MPPGINLLKVVYPQKSEECKINGYDFSKRKIWRNDFKKLSTQTTKFFKVVSNEDDVLKKQLGPFVPFWGSKEEEFFFSWKKEFFVGLNIRQCSRINEDNLTKDSIFSVDSYYEYSLKKKLLERFPDLTPTARVTGKFTYLTTQEKHLDFRDKCGEEVEIFLGKNYGVLVHFDYITL